MRQSRSAWTSATARCRRPLGGYVRRRDQLFRVAADRLRAVASRSCSDAAWCSWCGVPAGDHASSACTSWSTASGIRSQGQFGAFPLIVGTLLTSFLALIDRGAALARRRGLPDRIRPGGHPQADRDGDRAARRDSQRGLRPLGHLRPDPDPAARGLPVPAQRRSAFCRSSGARSTARRSWRRASSSPS